MTRGASLWLAAVLVLLSPHASAIDDRFDAAKYERGGFAPVKDDVYAKECGSCHFAYMPGMLPERSWRKVMATTDKHFGESLGIKPDVARHIESYLVANAADHSPYLGSELMLWELPKDAAPIRITSLPLMRHRHVVIRKLMADTNTPFKVLSNCETCHENAASGSFAYDRIVVPGISKIVRPGGMF
jgi:hypothetical protein